MPAAGKGKGKKQSNSRGGGKEKKTQRTTKAKRAGLEFSVARVQRQMKQKKYSDRVSVTAAVVLAATLEYMVAELLEVAGEAAKDNGRRTIKPRHIMLAARQDNELDLFLRDVTMPWTGVVQNIHEALAPKKKKKKA